MFNLITILKSIEIHRKVNYIIILENTLIFLIRITRTHSDYRISNSSFFSAYRSLRLRQWKGFK